MSGARVLVVDDEPQILRALETTLRGAGYEVETAPDGETALTRAAARPPEAVILDLVFPTGAASRSAVSSAHGWRRPSSSSLPSAKSGTKWRPSTPGPTTT